MCAGLIMLEVAVQVSFSSVPTTRSLVREVAVPRIQAYLSLLSDNNAETNRPVSSLHARTCMGRVPVGAALESAIVPCASS